MAIGPLGKSIKKSSFCEGLDKLILLKEQISADCLTLISLALQNSSKVLYEFYNMLCILQIGMLRFTERLNVTLLFLCKQLTSVVIKLCGDIFLTRVFS